MGATAPNNQGIKGEMKADSQQRAEYFGQGESSQHQSQVGGDIDKASAAAGEAADRAAAKYKEDKERRF